MSGYEQRARDYLDRFTEEPTWDVYSPDAQAALEAIFESIAAEARGLIERAAKVLEAYVPLSEDELIADLRAYLGGGT